MDEFKVNDNHKIILSSGGMLSAGEELTVVRSGYFIFDKKLTDINNICLAEIQDIRTLKIEGKRADVLIYHKDYSEPENPKPLSVYLNEEW